jgi:glycosyltransferase involved in cell wall biosynthesis
LLRLLKQLLNKTTGLKLVIMGDGPLRADLLSEAATMGLRCYNGWNPTEALKPDCDIYFPGYISNPFQFLKRSTLFLFPSGWEGFPLALCEAMISGVPVLAADCPTGPREIIAPGTFDAAYSLRCIEETEYGYLLPMADKQEFEEAWIKAIMDILNNNTKRIAFIANGKERMKAYDKTVVMQQWFDVIDKVLSK